jgi:hypothetical protein
MMTKFLSLALIMTMLAVVGVFVWQFSGLLYEGQAAQTAQTVTAGGAMALLGLIVCVDCGRRKYYSSPKRVQEILPEYAWPTGEMKKMIPTQAIRRQKEDRMAMLSMLSFGRDQVVTYVSMRLGDSARKRRQGRFIRKDGSGRVHIEMTARDGRPYRVRRQEYLVNIRKAVPDLMAA